MPTMVGRTFASVVGPMREVVTSVVTPGLGAVSGPQYAYAREEGYMDADSPRAGRSRGSAEGCTPVGRDRIEVPLATRAEIASVNRLTRQFCNPTPTTNPPADDRHGWADAIERDASVHGMAACIDGDALGYAVARCRGTEGELCYLLVAPPYRGQGVGTLLLAGVLEHLRHRSCTRVNLRVAAANEPALRLYRQAGFAVSTYVMRADLP